MVALEGEPGGWVGGGGEGKGRGGASSGAILFPPIKWELDSINQRQCDLNGGPLRTRLNRNQIKEENDDLNTLACPQRCQSSYKKLIKL